jgi:hypothetical protein
MSSLAKIEHTLKQKIKSGNNLGASFQPQSQRPVRVSLSLPATLKYEQDTDKLTLIERLCTIVE